MFDKHSLYSVHSGDFRRKRNGAGFLKKIILVIVIIAAILVSYNIIFSKNIAKNALKDGQILLAENKCPDAIEQFEKSAKRSKNNSDTLEPAIIGLWTCDKLDLAKQYLEKKEGQNLNTYKEILIIQSEKALKEFNSQNEITRIAYQIFYSNTVDIKSETNSELINKINSTASKETKKIIFAQFLNQNKQSYFGTEIAKKVVEKDKNYRDAYLALGYGYLKNHNLELAKATLLQAIEINPVHADTYKILAMVYKELGEDANYKSCLDKAKSLE